MRRIVKIPVLSTSYETSEPIMAAVSTRDLAKNMIRVKSSNLWAYVFHVSDNNPKLGEMLIQFKGAKGGPGDVYIYYDVPVAIYKKIVAAPSKGHAFWVFIRNKYHYSKLTGDKRTKMPLGIN